MKSEAETLFRDGRYDEVILLINAISSPSLADRVLRAQSYYATQRWEESLEDFRIVLRKNGPGGDFAFYQKGRTAIGQARLDKAANEDFWKSCSDSASLAMAPIIADVIDGGGEGSLDRFRAALYGILNDGAIAEAWISAFSILVAGCRGERVPRPAEQPPRRKILVSGTGWSGSGAIHAWLREFPGVQAVPGESSMLEGSGGLKSFIQASTTRQDCIETAVNFFFRGMLGYAPMRNASCFKELRGARENTLHPQRARRYAENVGRVTIELCGLIEAAGTVGDHLENKLKRLGNAISDNLIAYTVPEDRIALLDNCIHCQNIDLAIYMENTHILCCLRDPRSNYVSLIREYPGFSEDAALYVKTQRARRKRIDSHFSALRARPAGHDGCAVWRIGFEEFVVSAPLRDHLAVGLRLDPAEQDKFSKFKPWESMRNVLLHHEYEAQCEISEIEQQLAQYCIEPIARGLLETETHPERAM